MPEFKPGDKVKILPVRPINEDLHGRNGRVLRAGKNMLGEPLYKVYLRNIGSVFVLPHEIVTE